MPRWRCYGFPADPLTALTHDMRDEVSAGLAEAAASRQARAVILTKRAGPSAPGWTSPDRSSAASAEPVEGLGPVKVTRCHEFPRGDVPWLRTMEVWRGFGRTRDDGLALLAGRPAEPARPADAAAYPSTRTALMGWLGSSVCWPFSPCTSQ